MEPKIAEKAWDPKLENATPTELSKTVFLIARCISSNS